MLLLLVCALQRLERCPVEVLDIANAHMRDKGTELASSLANNMVLAVRHRCTIRARPSVALLFCYTTLTQ